MLSIRNMSDLWITLSFGYSFFPGCYFSSCVMHMKKQRPHFLQIWGTDRKMASKSLRRREHHCLLAESWKFWLCSACFPKIWMLKVSLLWVWIEFYLDFRLGTSIIVKWLLFSEYATYVSRKYITLMQIWHWELNLITICPIYVSCLFFL